MLRWVRCCAIRDRWIRHCVVLFKEQSRHGADRFTLRATETRELRAKLEGLKPRFNADPYCLKIVYTRVGEGTIAEHLNDTLRQFPDLLLGSYPKINHPEYMVKVTLESKDAEYVGRAFEHLLTVLPEGSVVRTEE